MISSSVNLRLPPSPLEKALKVQLKPIVKPTDKSKFERFIKAKREPTFVGSLNLRICFMPVPVS